MSIRWGRKFMTILNVVLAVLVVGTAGGAFCRTAIVYAARVAGLADERIQGARR